MATNDRLRAEPQDRTLLSIPAQIRYLLAEWKLMFSPATIASDAGAAVAVALVAVPLSLAIANASGVSPAVGLITAVVGGIVAALLGGSRLQVSGPSVALAFLTLEIVTHFGMEGLIWAMLISGVFQILAGYCRIGRFMQFIPHPVISGFLTGIGMTILASQAPVILGYYVTRDQEGGALALAWNTLRQLEQTNLHTLLVGMTAFSLMLLVPRYARRFPAPLVAVTVASLLCYFADWNDVLLLGKLPAGLPWPGLPPVPQYEWNEVILAASTIFLIGTLESLLTASVVDSMTKGRHVDHDQELVGQGFANIASSFFGGTPVSGAIARSATSIQSGGRTRLAAVLHALFMLAGMISLSTLASKIPTAALAGVLSAVALRMIETKIFQRLWRGNRPEAIVFLVTAAAIIATDLIDGVQIGMVATVIYFVYEMSKMNLNIVPVTAVTPGDEELSCSRVSVLRVEGPLFFASGFHLRSMLRRLIDQRVLIIDFENAPFLDATGGEILAESIELAESRGIHVILARLSGSMRARLASLELPALIRTPLYDEMRDALLHASTLLDEQRLCRECRGAGRCQALNKALTGIADMDRTHVPSVRAVVGGGESDDWSMQDTREQTAEEALPTNRAFKPPRQATPTIDPTAFVDPKSSVTGAIVVARRAFIGANANLRADDGAPFYIGEAVNIQDGAMLHALKDKLILVKGRPYAIYIGANTVVTHNALIHGPCYIGSGCVIGFKAMVHDALLGEGSVVGLGAIVVGVSVPAKRFVNHGLVVDTQDKADALPEVDEQWDAMRKEVVEGEPVG